MGPGPGFKYGGEGTFVADAAACISSIMQERLSYIFYQEARPLGQPFVDGIFGHCSHALSVCSSLELVVVGIFTG